jgi:hypothetical protein
VFSIALSGVKFEGFCHPRLVNFFGVRHMSSCGWTAGQERC